MALGKDAPREGDLKPAAAITVIARDTALRGEVAGKASLRVEGKVAGSVAVDGTLEVAEGARSAKERRRECCPTVSFPSPRRRNIGCRLSWRSDRARR